MTNEEENDIVNRISKAFQSTKQSSPTGFKRTEKTMFNNLNVLLTYICIDNSMSRLYKDKDKLMMFHKDHEKDITGPVLFEYCMNNSDNKMIKFDHELIQYNVDAPFIHGVIITPYNKPAKILFEFLEDGKIYTLMDILDYIEDYKVLQQLTGEEE